MPTKKECQTKIFNLGIKFGVSPKLIATRLLSLEDKEDMLNGLVPDSALETAIVAWRELQMPDYANGFTLPHSKRL